MMRPEHVRRERLPRIVPRLPDMRRSRAVKARRGAQLGSGLRHGSGVEEIDVLSSPACNSDARFNEEIDKMAARKPTATSDQNGSQDLAQLANTSGGHLRARSERTGEVTGQLMASFGSFHMIPDSCAGAYSVVAW